MDVAVVAFLFVVTTSLVLQVLFSVLYWKWIPAWISNPYGRLAQLGSLSHIILLSLYIFFQLFGPYLNVRVAEAIFVSGFIPLIIFGALQLVLLKRAVDSSRSENKEEEASNDG